MSLRFPPKDNFKGVPEQVIEFFRSLSANAIEQDADAMEATINSFLATLSQLMERADELENLLIQSSQFDSFIQGINERIEGIEQTLETQDNINAKIQQIESAIDDIECLDAPDFSDLKTGEN